MLAIGNNNIIPTSPSLVSPQIPKSDAFRAAYYDVQPSVSSQQIADNAASSAVYSKSANAQNYIQVQTANAETSSAYSGSSPASYNPQTAFLAQLAAGDISPEVRGIFVQYEKLVSYGNVKYKPSDAGKPNAPAGLFETILHGDNTENTPQEVSSPPPAPTEKFVPAQYSPAQETRLPQLAAYAATIKLTKDIPVEKTSESQTEVSSEIVEKSVK